jgi:L-threonylcarbamoyladenylate synthase
MITQTRTILDSGAVQEAIALLEAGEIIAAPTDTVYGLMARFDDPAAIARLYEAKGRPPRKPIPVLVGDLAQLAQVTPLPLAPVAERLAARFWPGPLTLVLPALATLPPILTADQPTVGVRMPNHGALRALIRRTGPLAATSANRSGATEARTAAEVLAQLGGRIPLILAGDEDNLVATQDTLPSTVVDVTNLSDGEPSILREGPLGSIIRILFSER